MTSKKGLKITCKQYLCEANNSKPVTFTVWNTAGMLEVPIVILYWLEY